MGLGSLVIQGNQACFLPLEELEIYFVVCVCVCWGREAEGGYWERDWDIHR